MRRGSHRGGGRGRESDGNLQGWSHVRGGSVRFYPRDDGSRPENDGRQLLTKTNDDLY